MNHILLAMSPDHRAELSHHLEPVELKSGQEIESADRLIPSLYFVETGIAAVVTIGERARVALGLIGCEGVSGLGLWLGDTQSAYSTVMLTDGTALRITAIVLNRKGIERVAGSSYGRPEKEFVRLIGTFWPPVRRRRKNSN